MRKTLTYDDAVALLDRAVAEKGADYVYPEEEKREGGEFGSMMCQYRTDSGGPSCIIGFVGNYLGVLDQFTEAKPGVENLKNAGYDFDNRTYALLDESQSDQDWGITWGESVERAKNHVSNGL